MRWSKIDMVQGAFALVMLPAICLWLGRDDLTQGGSEFGTALVLTLFAAMMLAGLFLVTNESGPDALLSLLFNTMTIVSVFTVAVYTLGTPEHFGQEPTRVDALYFTTTTVTTVATATSAPSHKNRGSW